MAATDPVARVFWAPGRVNLIGEHTTTAGTSSSRSPSTWAADPEGRRRRL